MPTPEPDMSDRRRQVTLTLTNVGEWDADTADALFVALNGELEFGTRDGLGFIEVPMDAEQLWAQLPQVIDAISRVLPDAEVVRVEVGPSDWNSAAA